MIEPGTTGPLVVSIPAGERDEAGARALPLANLTRDLVAVHVGQADVEQDDLRALRIDRLEGRMPVVHHPRLVPHRLQQGLKHFGGINVVIDHEHAHGNCRALKGA
jgi:hypothetical protein